MFFLATNTLTFPITLPADFVAEMENRYRLRKAMERA